MKGEKVSPDTELLRVEQVADRLGVKAQTVRRMVRDGRLDALRLGDGPKAPIRIPAANLFTGFTHTAAL
jgi:excisionase family DNA binding protein